MSPSCKINPYSQQCELTPAQYANILDGNCERTTYRETKIDKNNIITANGKFIPDDTYYKDINDQNTAVSKLLTDESNYFLSRYGEPIYRQLLDIRRQYIVDNSAPDEFPDNSYSMIIEHINQLYNMKNLDIPVLNYLNTYLPSFDANATYRQIEYTSEEANSLAKMNYYINVLYYILFIILLLLLASSNNLLFRERFVTYIFLAILPILFPWIFIICRRIWRYFFPILDYGGPNEIDTNTNKLTMFSNNASNLYKQGINTTTMN
jgi:hypothetical protein